MSLAYEGTYLSSDITIADYRELEDEQDRDRIADFILCRFTERYIVPLESKPTKKEKKKEKEKHGFSMMAISCLMIEALESFRQGWPDTRDQDQETGRSNSEKAFRCFFSNSNNEPLAVFSKRPGDFYTHVRCGILHQGETTGGWRIRRDGCLFDPVNTTINATLFLQGLGQCLENYCQELKEAEWNDQVWKNLRNKMKAVCDNCRSR